MNGFSVNTGGMVLRKVFLGAVVMQCCTTTFIFKLDVPGLQAHYCSVLTVIAVNVTAIFFFYPASFLSAHPFLELSALSYLYTVP